MRETGYALAGTGRLLQASLRAEYEARAFYRTMADAYGERKPFPALLATCQKRIDWLTDACRRYGCPCPPDVADGEVRIAGQWREDCRRAIEGEAGLVKGYLRFASHAGSGGAVLLFDKLSRHSLAYRLPLLQRALASADARERFHAARGIPPEEAYLKHGFFSTMLEQAFSVLGSGHSSGHSIPGKSVSVLRKTSPVLLGGLVFGGAMAYVLKRKSPPKRKGG